MPGPSFYPRWKVALIVRLEEYGAEGEVVKYARQRKIVSQLKAAHDERAPLEAVQDKVALTVSGQHKWTLQARGSQTFATSGGPLDQKNDPDNLTFEIPGVIPTMVNWGHNGFRQADTLNVTLRFTDLPVDPRIVRACGVKFFLGVISARDAADGALGGTRTVRDTQGFPSALEPQSVLPEEWIDNRGRIRSNLRFKGWVDKWTVIWPDDGEAEVQLECRDNTSLLLEQEMPVKLALPSLNTMPLDQAVATLLSNFPQLEGLSVEYRPPGLQPPSLNNVLSKTAYRPQLGPVASKGGAPGPGGGSKLALWDYLTDVTGAIGHMLYMEDDTVVIQPVRTATSSAYPQRFSDPYNARQKDGIDLKRRTLIYGRDLGEMRIIRNYSKASPTNIEVRCYGGADKQVIVARFPEKPDERIVHVGLGDHAETKWTVIRVSGINDARKLRVLAQSYYESVGRQEISVTLKTNELSAFGGSDTDPDMLDVRAGDSIDILFDRGTQDEFNSYAQVEDVMLSAAKATKFLTGLGFDPEFAAAYAEQYSNAGFQTTFRLRSMGITCQDEGVEISLDLMNYVELRADKFLTGGATDDAAMKEPAHPLAPQGTHPKPNQNTTPSNVLDPSILKAVGGFGFNIK